MDWTSLASVDTNGIPERVTHQIKYSYLYKKEQNKNEEEDSSDNGYTRDENEDDSDSDDEVMKKIRRRGKKSKSVPMFNGEKRWRFCVDDEPPVLSKRI